MKEDTKPDTKFVFDEAKVKEHFNKILDFQDKFKGLKNHNPYLWTKNNVLPLVDRFNGGERTETLYNKILDLPLEHVPIINPNAIDNAEPVKKPEPIGLKL